MAGADSLGPLAAEDLTAPHTPARSFWVLLAQAERVASGIYLVSALAFAFIGLPGMVALEVASALFHAAVWQWLRVRPQPLAAWLVAGHLAGHAAVAVPLLGWSSGFAYPLILLLPLVFLTGLRRTATKVAVAGGAIGLYLGLDLLMQHLTPLSPAPERATLWLHVFNTVATLGFLSYLAWMHAELVRRAEHRLRRAADSDALTGLANRRRLLDLAAYEQARGRGEEALSLVMCDIDHFKAINDRYGHATGDEVLRSFAVRLTQVARTGDCVARWGGEEFLMLLPDCDATAALWVCERLRQVLSAEPFDVGGGQRLAITATLGTATLRPRESIEAAIARADAALYEGKRAGRNRVVAAG